MFSVLIPCYNQDVTTLVRDLVAEGTQLIMPFEVRCYDDGSNDNWKQLNSSIAILPNVTYQELPQNLGRSAIRQKLASEAIYDKLLFLDGDSGVTQSGFLSRYLKHSKNALVTGGRIYTKDKMEVPFTLHWTYGTERESLPLERRQGSPATYFHSNNFMIDKQLFLNADFDQGINGYGYEDLLFAKRLLDQGISITHIDNPIVHLQLDRTEDFLAKTRIAIANLKQLNAQNISLDTRLEAMASKLRSVGLSGVVAKVLGWREESILHNLRSSQPLMRLMDYYKLLLYLRS